MALSCIDWERWSDPIIIDEAEVLDREQMTRLPPCLMEGIQ